ncbi:type II secretion system protein N [Primorskyibacter sp. 2E233]|uniref:type II secretion system protein N n=1 Tax=Primorskyibacter sp. 2E233 TaxID=3413431 RepID=UPI003BF2D71F
MRWLAWIMTIALLALAGQSGFALWSELNAPAVKIGVATLPEAADGEAPQAPMRPPRNWPALFGEPQPPKPPAPPPQAPQPEPQPPKPPKPPLGSLGYALKGMVQTGDATWAMVFHPTGEQLVRTGDMLADDIEVVRIDDDGVWISRQGDAPELLGFEE